MGKVYKTISMRLKRTNKNKILNYSKRKTEQNCSVFFISKSFKTYCLINLEVPEVPSTLYLII